jgi:glycosyltransferase involved in cell wall biosynthesis
MGKTKVLCTSLYSTSHAKPPMNRRIRVLLLIPHSGGGGAERVLTLLAQNLSRDKYELHLGIATSAGRSGNVLPADVTIHLLGATRVRAAAFPLLGLVRKLKPQVIVSGMFHLSFLVLLLRPLFPRATRVLVRQHGTVSTSLTQDHLPVYTRLLYRLLYRRADCVICQTVAMAKDLARELALDEGRIVVLPNPLDVEAIRTTIERSPDKWIGTGPHLLAIGRLSSEKGFDLLLEAFQSVRTSFPSADLLIAGTGPEKIALRDQCCALGLEASVRFAGYVDQPDEHFPGASLFVLSSRHEGMPNALLEAAAAGLPLVALPASGGVVDLLRGHPGAWLAPEVSATALGTTLLDALAKLTPGQRFTHAFIEPFRMERATRAYEELIDATIEERQQ